MTQDDPSPGASTPAPAPSSATSAAVARSGMTGHSRLQADRQARQREGVPYRHDLDGLRAVAIVLVAVYHVFVHRVSGGVDVFLLLSGFFVVGGLMRGFRSADPVRLTRYVPKLVLRLLPTMAVTLAAVLVATSMLLPRSRWAQVAQETLASLTYRQNWFLATNGQQYGAADVMQSPPQHIWSLSVQGQLFLAVPVLLLVVWTVTARLSRVARYRALVVVLVATFVVSFAYAIYMVGVDQPWAYYDTGARAWEYLAGGLLALCVHKIRLSPLVADLSGIVGIVLVLAAGLVVDGASTFPGLTALLPLTGAALLIASGPTGSPAPDTGGGVHARRPTTRLRPGVVNKVLAWAPVSRAGRYAYAYYLWHWPVLIFTIVATGATITPLAGALVLVAAALLSYLSHTLVEAALRGSNGRAAARPRAGRRLLGWVLTLACVAVAAIAPVRWLAHVTALEEQAARRVAVAQPSLADFTGTANDFPEVVRSNPGALSVAFPDILPGNPGAPLIPDPTVAGRDIVRPQDEACNLAPGQAVPNWCEYGDPDADVVLAAVGGSHVRTWVDVLDALGKEHGFAVRTSIKWSCTFFTGTDGIDPAGFADDCVQWNAAVMDELLADPPDAVFSIATRSAGTGDFVPGAYIGAWAQLNDAGIAVIGVRDNPYLPFSPNECVVTARLEDPSCIATKSEVYAATSPFNNLDKTTLPRTQFIDLSSIYCPQDTCPLVQGGRVVYLDNSHLTASYAQTLAPILDRSIQPLLGWW